MPVQPRFPLGGLASNIDTTDERLRSRQVERFGIASLSQGAAFTFPAGTGWFTTGWSLTFTTGVTGSCVVYMQTTNFTGTLSGLQNLGLWVNGSLVATVAYMFGGLAGFTLSPSTEYTGNLEIWTNTSVPGAGFFGPYAAIWPL